MTELLCAILGAWFGLGFMLVFAASAYRERKKREREAELAQFIANLHEHVAAHELYQAHLHLRPKNAEWAKC